ncbi:MAG: hypothetical protein IT320_24610 [Anaerolineae bacterium]|nr:hypothetical protein [Anaerolineae bacterium]
MPMQPGFDLDSLLRFTPPHYVCERCFALLTDVPANGGYRCPVCDLAYVPTEEYPSACAYLAASGLALGYDDLMAHAQRMANIARRARGGLAGQTPDTTPMSALLEAMGSARHCIHFTTFGISAWFVGALKMAAQRIDVRGVISGIKRDEVYRELTTYANDAPRLQTRLFGQDSQWYPHQKIVVIDGLIAFKGSANLTDIGWRKAAHGREVVEVITDVAEVVELNNRFFSPVWVGFDQRAQHEAHSTASSNGR